MDNNVMFEEQDGMEEAPKGKRRLVLLIVGGVLLLAVLGMAAFVGGQLLNRNQAGTGDNLLLMMGGSRNEEAVGVPVVLPPELPPQTADAIGTVVRRDNNSIFINQKGGEAEVEIVVTTNTRIYRDITPTTELAEQMVVEEVGNADEIGEDNIVIAWGEKTGDRVVAETLWYYSGRRFRERMIGRSKDAARRRQIYQIVTCLTEKTDG